MTHPSCPVQDSSELRAHAKGLLSDPDLLCRPSWTDASLALRQIHKGRATGSKRSLRLRCKLQASFFSLGCLIQRRADTVLVLGALLIGMSCVGLKSITVETDVEVLWVEGGGRLEKELTYTRNTLGKGSGTIHQIVIQSAREQGVSVLYPDSLLHHMDAVLAASRVTIEMFDVQWRLKDLCLVPTYPFSYEYQIEQIFEKLFPCVLITPLDCFWEGSKLLGPEHAVYLPLLNSTRPPPIRWTNLNPQKLVQSLRDSYPLFSFQPIEDFFKGAGITSAYQEKPCLDPNDPQCPDSSPNKKSRQPPDVGAELTGGCYGYAVKHMHWPEDLIVGGKKKNKTGYIQRAEAFQTIVELMGEKQLYEHWAQDFKVHSVDWSLEKAALILDTWQEEFLKELTARVESPRSGSGAKTYRFSSFATQKLNSILERFSEMSYVKLVVAFLLVMAYAAVVLFRWDRPALSRSGLGVAGVVLVAASVAAALGVCQLLVRTGLMMDFNASTMQIIPFLSLGLGAGNLFFLVHNYAHVACGNFSYQIGELLKRTGVVILLISSCNIFSFLVAAIIPIPALRAFSLQMAVVVTYNLFTVLVIFPAVLCLDLRRRSASRFDLLCCFKAPDGPVPKPRSATDEEARKKYLVPSAAVDDQTAMSLLDATEESGKSAQPALLTAASISTKSADPLSSPGYHCPWDLGSLARDYYANWLLLRSVKIVVLVALAVLLAGSVWGATVLKNGLNLTDVVPRNTREYQFLSAQSRYFGFYHMYAVTKGDFEYPTNQKLLHEYHDSFTRVPKIIKNDDGGLPPFWLSLFRDWLIGLQKAFDRDRTQGLINVDGWLKNASDEGVLAYKLLVQTGHVDNPVDKSLVNHVRLVDAEGVINPKAFYNYLSAWTTNDALAYSFSQADFHPEPKKWFHNSEDVDLKIPKSQPLVYAQLPFFLNNLADTPDITNMIEAVRSICLRFEDRGLPNFPSGIPFTYWEQYLDLRSFLVLGLSCALAAVLLCVGVVLVNIGAAILVASVILVTIIELTGMLGFLDIRLSAIPAVILITSVGICTQFAVHIVVGFLTSMGSRDHRTRVALEHMLPPTLHGAIPFCLSISVLLFSDYDFIIRYFFLVIIALLLFGLLNGLVLFPVLLSLLGPRAEVILADNGNRLPSLTPYPSPVSHVKDRHKSASGNLNVPLRPPLYYKSGPRRMSSDMSLSTITEEPNSWQSNSHEIVVQPEVVVETTTCPSNCSSTSASETSSGSRGSHVTTKVTATTKVKVEVHSSRSGASIKESSRRKRGSPCSEDISSS